VVVNWIFDNIQTSHTNKRWLVRRQRLGVFGRQGWSGEDVYSVRRQSAYSARSDRRARRPALWVFALGPSQQHEITWFSSEINHGRRCSARQLNIPR